MQKEKIIIPNKKDINFYKKYDLNTFLLPLEDYSIGFDVYFNIDEINKIAVSSNVIVLMNKLLHRKINTFRNEYYKFNSNIKFIVEDIGLSDIISKDRIILYENHIISNYSSINFLNSIGYNNIVINNDLTINEIKEILSNTKSNLYYFYISKNMIMYSRRYLVSNFNKNYNLNHKNNTYKLDEKVTHKIIDIKEEDEGSTVRYDKVFCASKYIDDLNELNLIIDFSNIDEENEKIILNNIDSKELCNLIDSDYYFLENEIKYKVGDLK